jgi:hypothetical protein
MQKRQRAQDDLDKIAFFQRMTYWFETSLPKTNETNLVLVRVLQLQRDENRQMRNPMDFSQDETVPTSLLFGPDMDIEQRMEAVILGHSLIWVIGTSLAFEAVIVMLAAWIFCRRDY